MKQSDLTKKDVDTFHKKLDKLVHKTFGHSSKEKKDMKTEDLALMAQKAEMDHEVQMARSDLYKAAKYSIKLHDMLKSVSEQQGLEGWVAAKITKASDYLSSVYHYMEYEMMSQNESSEKKRLTYLDEGILDLFQKGKAKLQKYARSFNDPATKAAMKGDDISQARADVFANDVLTLAGRNQVDVSKGVPTDLILGYIATYLQNDPDFKGKFDQENVKTVMQREFPLGKAIPQDQLKNKFSLLSRELIKIKLDKLPQQPQAQQTAPGKVPGMVAQNSSIDYKESLANKLQSKLQESAKTCKDCGKPTWETLDEAEKQKGVDGKVCWKGYKRMGTKMKGGKRVDNCVPIKKK